MTCEWSLIDIYVKNVYINRPTSGWSCESPWPCPVSATSSLGWPRTIIHYPWIQRETPITLNMYSVCQSWPALASQRSWVLNCVPIAFVFTYVGVLRRTCGHFTCKTATSVLVEENQAVPVNPTSTRRWLTDFPKYDRRGSIGTRQRLLGDLM